MLRRRNPLKPTLSEPDSRTDFTRTSLAPTDRPMPPVGRSLSYLSAMTMATANPGTAGRMRSRRMHSLRGISDLHRPHATGEVE